jgi:hypothetical protein
MMAIAWQVSESTLNTNVNQVHTKKYLRAKIPQYVEAADECARALTALSVTSLQTSCHCDIRLGTHKVHSRAQGSLN